ncbi:MAG TPA: ATP-binding protein [Anaerolineae bacterium]|nr:ATP-binding protein [Anaerolineae bacterium]
MTTNSGMSQSTVWDLRHLRAELARLDLLIHREVRRWQLADQDPNDSFRGLHISDAEAERLLQRPLGTSWGQTVSLPPEEEAAFAQAYAQAADRAQAVRDAARKQGHTLRLDRLAAAFDLAPFDYDALLVCLAPALDLRYERLYGYLQDDVTRKRPRVNLVLDLLCGPGPERLQNLARFAPDAPLFKHHLLERVPEAGAELPPLLSQPLRVDDTIVAWLLGAYRPREELGARTALQQLRPGEADALLDSGTCVTLEHALAVGQAARRPAERPLLAFYGVDEAGQEAAARWLAAQAGRPLLAVDLAAVAAAGTPPLAALRLALRDARLTGAIPYLAGWDACWPQPPQGGESARRAPSTEMVAELCAFPDLLIVAGQESWQPQGLARERPLFWIEFAVPPYSQRYALWFYFLNREPHPPSAEAEDRDLAALAGQFLLTTGQIRDAVASARDRAIQRGEPLDSLDLFAAARLHSNPHLGSLARKITPRYEWDDIVLPEDQLAVLREIVVTVRQRPLVLEEWGVGRKLASSAGVTVLFAGPPGTGKTMAAEIIAAELGLDLYKIDLSTIVSKYIGETEKNLERIFSEAQSSNAILFFDEADAIFGKRSEVKDAHDRYANIEISYLLQRMEAYDGVTILATNLRANLDEAFTRRLQFAVDFPFPEEADRLRIWRTLFPPEVPREPDLDFGLLARRFKLAGGNIRNIIVSAAYLAADATDGDRRVTMQHLLHSTRRELQKMGRLVNERDLRIEA